VADGHEGDPLEYVVRGSHRTLVRRIPLSPPPPLARVDPGVVVVPLSRSEPVLETPARLAVALGWPLLLLCSRGNQAVRVCRIVKEFWPGTRVTGADLLSGDLLRAPGIWTTASHRASESRASIDTNRKRNLGLAAARMTGRSWVLFVDDDVLRLNAGQVAEAVRHLAATGSKVAGWPCEWFPDNSVVHHARRDFLGLHQDVFLGAGALLVRADDAWEPPGFPPTYNEDWLFLYEPIARGLVVAGPDIGQATYNPYARPERARDEEFGDVLGEGLFHLLHVREPVEVAIEAAYWHSVHAKRTKLIRRIVAELRERLAVVATESEQARLVHALAAIEESRKQLTRATPASLADFVRRWRLDEQLWRSYLTRLPPRDTLKQALVYLGLHESWIVGAEP
jgi:hypothetical protein